jgi:uncharacterized protein (TIGR02145 family)
MIINNRTLRALFLATAVTAVAWSVGCGDDPYETVTIGGKKWMKKNLNIKTENSWCYGEGARVSGHRRGEYATLSDSEIQANCAKYGRLYTWEAAKSACPAGWHLPSRAEWRDLVRAVDPNSQLKDDKDNANIAGKKLKAKDGWLDNGNGTDDYGFSALPCGSRHPFDVSFITPGNSNSGHGWTATEQNAVYAGERVKGCWWTATELNAAAAGERVMNYGRDIVYEGYSYKDATCSVRCVRNYWNAIIFE